MRMACKRRIRVRDLIGVVMLLHIAGCVIVPHPASHEVERADQIEGADLITITVGPRELIDEVSRRIVKHSPDIEIVDPLTFRDTAFPDGGWSLKELLDTKRCTEVAEQLDVQYLVLLSEAQVETGDEKGFLIPFLGAMAASEESTLGALVIDLRHGAMLSQLSATSSGKGGMLYYVIFMVATDPMTESAVIKGLSESIAKTLENESHEGELRIAVLAGEVPEKTNEQASVPFRNTGTEWDLQKDIGAYCPNADLGHADAQKHIADIYYFGTYNIDRDLVRAYVWYTLAVNGGNENAEKTLSLVISELTPEQLKEAQNLLKEWAPGQCEDDLNVHVERLHNLLLKLCREADAGHTKAQFELGRTYWRRNDIPDNRSKSYMWYMYAANHNLGDGQYYNKSLIKRATIEVEYKRDKVLSEKELNKAMQLLSTWKAGQCARELVPENTVE